MEEDTIRWGLQPTQLKHVGRYSIRGGSRKASEGEIGQNQVPRLLIGNLMTLFSGFTLQLSTGDRESRTCG